MFGLKWGRKRIGKMKHTQKLEWNTKGSGGEKFGCPKLITCYAIAQFCTSFTVQYLTFNFIVSIYLFLFVMFFFINLISRRLAFLSASKALVSSSTGSFM